MTDPFQPNATINITCDGDTVFINHISRLGSRHVMPLTVEGARMLIEELTEVTKPEMRRASRASPELT
jgi:hypothetical protein